MAGAIWTTDQDVALARYVEAGKRSYAEIAALLNTEFGSEFTRNAAIGRARRIGVSVPIKVKRPAPERKPRVRIVRSSSNSTAHRIVESVSIALPKFRCAEVEPRHLALLGLAPDDCRYPYGDGPITFCGHAKMAGSSYCPAHFELTRGQGTYGERDAARALAKAAA